MSKARGDPLGRMRNAADPAERRAAATEIVRITKKREHLEAALAVLEREAAFDGLSAAEREALRERAAAVFDHPAGDRGGFLRERLLRLLAAGAEPAELEIFSLAVGAYSGTGDADLLQGLRATALRGLARLDPDEGRIHAVRLLGETRTSRMSGEPTLTAASLLGEIGEFLPLYHFLLRQADAFTASGNGETVGRAFVAVAPHLPVPLLMELSRDLVAADDPALGSGVVEGIVARRETELLPVVETVVRGTIHGELRHYAAVLLATSRDEEHRALLYRLAREAHPSHRMDFVEGVELTAGEGRDDLLRELGGAR